MAALGQALRKGMLPKLDDLRLGHNHRADISFVLSAIAEGGAPNLISLNLSETNVNAARAESLVQALSSGKVPKLKRLELCGTAFDKGQSVVNILLSLHGCPDLRVLDVSSVAVEETGWSTPRALIDAFVQGKLPSLEGLSAGFQVWGDEGVSALADAFLAGAGQRLKIVNMCRIHVSDAGLRRLAEAFRQGCCPVLEELRLRGGNPMLSVEVFDELQTALQLSPNRSKASRVE